MTTAVRCRWLVVAALALSGAASCSRERADPKTGFNGDQALVYAQTQVGFGPRVPGTEGHRRTGDWIVKQMRERADTVVEQRWTHVTQRGDSLPMRNILARFRPDMEQRVLYVAHWDTRPVADSDRNLGARQMPIPGANDGASGVALLIALGDVLKKTPPSVGVDLLFVDGEDYGSFADPQTDVLIGSRYFADHLPSSDYRPLFGIVWDMIGDRDLTIYQEGNSVQAAPEVVQRVWQTAKDLGYDDYFVPEVIEAITDDHLPLIKKGLRVIDVIDIDYGPPVENGGPRPAATYHHTMQDTIDKIAARSLQIVGDVATSLVTPR